MDFFKLTQYVNPKRVVDIGAHVGDFTRQLANMSTGCEFILVEANPHCEEYLKLLMLALLEKIDVANNDGILKDNLSVKEAEMLNDLLDKLRG